MKERKTSIIILFILFALPAPFSLISWIGTLISVANIGMTNWSEFSQCIQGLAALITMLLAGTYLVTYIISLGATLKNNKISLISFLPMLHIILFSIFFVVWMWLNAIYKA
ncbi:hypothetical protein [Lutispora saccharofermentans]|uniref:Uncharacterized protein n=1 Tax=Lutispora saccharofermentans TaxID=3024236 RepID=A0ABT1NHF3_9FIRM|nr:hypothetical protein [Lutispora saccharofermentans]MCQ1530705.1 hypothetical protein [Lutispora saccharofermentans]